MDNVVLDWLGSPAVGAFRGRAFPGRRSEDRSVAASFDSHPRAVFAADSLRSRVEDRMDALALVEHGSGPGCGGSSGV